MIRARRIQKMFGCYCRECETAHGSCAVRVCAHLTQSGLGYRADQTEQSMRPASHSQFGLAGGPPGRSGASCAMGPAAGRGHTPGGYLCHADKGGGPCSCDQNSPLRWQTRVDGSKQIALSVRRQHYVFKPAKIGPKQEDTVRRQPPVAAAARLVLQKRLPADAVAVRPIALKAQDARHLADANQPAEPGSARQVRSRYDLSATWARKAASRFSAKSLI